ncbi:hypothetical protein CC86DRAFT_421659 [Ophiobolus disseminans]|uniref:Heterokaryon incompatibility domain-containing protein n=1 Tax=Ophiobolus disseminans TaxID=1469910 RepID=A0A6A6ZT42_9PLEO|nr:hypothetical protein CC86DRAFT_421659 [Ophiobolus disseminans]
MGGRHMYQSGRRRGKGVQIPLMRRIFRDAHKVLAWLSDGAKEERGMKMLKQLSRLPTTVTTNPLRYDDLKYTQDDKVAICAFMSLAWFTRVWTIQEVVMNIDIVLVCRSSEITWLRLTIASQ